MLNWVPKGVTFWINSGDMHIAKRLLNHKGEGKGIWWFFFLHDISNSWLPSGRLKTDELPKPCCMMSLQRAQSQKEPVTLQFLSVSIAQGHRPPPSHLPRGNERVGLAFTLMSLLHLSVVTFSPWGNWGVRQVNSAYKKSVMGSRCCRPELQNSSSFLRLCSILQLIFHWAGWQACPISEHWRGLWHEALRVVKNGMEISKLCADTI